ncbi:dTDP-glucose 4,6-dehydratase [Melghirimyces algeriensis]|uniref:dTDP-glucose 4,6-dehydratase n=1 Tax=Melghirimyces algeriensis TaxID=910412 RepID=A0A521AAN8_9BACL|nr:dTDP-glucose 4,6-dehydratase [Melghirimyces algeriensis]SMO31872.1 dTDP-glucose 4,6-dehydratase [Melghirimyces algeriensis]
MKLLVTGGMGFIGSHLIRYLLKKHPTYHIMNLDRLTYAGNSENLQDIAGHDNLQFIKGDIRDRDLVDTIMAQGVSVIVNCAAESHVDRSIQEPSIFVQNNIVGTQMLLEAAQKYQVKKYVQISTDEVYGSLGDRGFFTEETPLAPNSPYSASKASADLLVHAYHQTFQLPVNITRCSNNYGPYQFPEKLIPLMIIQALQDKPLPLYGDGRHIRDWLYVEDHCAAIDLVIHKGIDGEVYNIGGNNEKTNLQIVEKILALLDKPKDLIRFVPDRPGHDRRYAIDATKIQTQLGWHPQYAFEAGIAQTVQWYVAHQDWWNKE